MHSRSQQAASSTTSQSGERATQAPKKKIASTKPKADGAKSAEKRPSKTPNLDTFFKPPEEGTFTSLLLVVSKPGCCSHWHPLVTVVLPGDQRKDKTYRPPRGSPAPSEDSLPEFIPEDQDFGGLPPDSSDVDTSYMGHISVKDSDEDDEKGDGGDKRVAGGGERNMEIDRGEGTVHAGAAVTKVRTS